MGTPESSGSRALDRVTEWLFDRGWLLWIGVGIPIVVGAVYAFTFIEKGCCSTSAWGEFGDFFGGTLNPLLAYFSLVALALTLREQRRLTIELDGMGLVNSAQGFGDSFGGTKFPFRPESRIWQ